MCIGTLPLSIYDIYITHSLYSMSEVSHRNTLQKNRITLMHSICSFFKNCQIIFLETFTDILFNKI